MLSITVKDIGLKAAPEVFFGKGVLKMRRKFTGKCSCQNAISIKMQNNFIKITFRHDCSPLNLLNIFRTFFEELLLLVTRTPPAYLKNRSCTEKRAIVGP